MTIRPEDAPLDSDDELADDSPAAWKRRLLRRVVWNGVLAVLAVGTLWLVGRLVG